MIRQQPLICALALALAALPLLAQAQARPNEGMGAIEVSDTLISVSGSGYQRSIDCKGRKLEVAGSDHVVSATGECAHVDVSGGNNTVTATLQPKGMLEVAGSGHKVNWKSNGEIRQDISGANHKITRLK